MVDGEPGRFGDRGGGGNPGGADTWARSGVHDRMPLPALCGDAGAAELLLLLLLELLLPPLLLCTVMGLPAATGGVAGADSDAEDASSAGEGSAGAGSAGGLSWHQGIGVPCRSSSGNLMD